MEQLTIAKVLEAQFGLGLISAFLGQNQTYLNNARSSCRARGRKHVPDLGSAKAVVADGANSVTRVEWKLRMQLNSLSKYAGARP